MLLQEIHHDRPHNFVYKQCTAVLVMNVEEMYQETEMEIVFVNEQNFGKRIKVFVNKRRTNWNVHFFNERKKTKDLDCS